MTPASPRRPVFGTLVPLALAIATFVLAYPVAQLSIAAFADTPTIVHVLNRLGYGPRPGDIEHVRAMGVDAYIARQLRPQLIQDREVERRLERFQSLDLTTATIVRQFHLPAQDARRRRREAAARSADAAADGNERRPSGDSAIGDAAARRPRGEMPPEVQRERLLYQELMEQKLVRAVASERQLEEVLVDFWFNHFNVSVQKGPMIRPFLTEYEQDVIRPHVLGRFRDLLGAVAESPAMLIYLDNWLSSDPDAPDLHLRGGRGNTPLRPSFAPGRRRFGVVAPRRSDGNRGPRDARSSLPRMIAVPPVRPGRRDGLNENYARELLELHTLGVDGGYTQDDIVDVARALAGWTIAPLPLGGGFRFEPRLHADGKKTVLGRTIESGGKRDGDTVLDLLAQHRSTARFIATKLATRFVSDDPPTSLIERAAERFLETDGNLREVTRTVVTSPEFFSAAARRAKVKTPLEFVVSGVRALDARVESGRHLARALRELGMPLYACQPPTGYSDQAAAWVSTGALLARMNFAVALVQGRLAGVRANLDRFDGAARTSVSELLATLVVEPASEAMRATLGEATSAEQFAMLALGSPEFQRR